MENKNLIYGIIAFLFLVGLSFFVWNNYQIQIQERSDKPIKLPPQVSGKCGIENCHGLEITCGSNIPDACTTMYQLGDNCRQFASCQIVSGSCRLEESAEFEKCKSCVKKCELGYKDNPGEIFQCGGKCSE